MREILFRGQRVDNGEWVYGTPFFVQEENFVSIITNCQTLNFKDATYTGYSVKPESIGQFVGRFDKNENKIFKGDKVKLGGSVVFVVEFIDGAFRFKNSDTYILPIDLPKTEEIEIIE